MPKFKSLIIDPPWPYEAASKSEKMRGFVQQDGNSKYETLSIEDLKALPINDVMDEKEAYIFLWTTSPFIPYALELIKAWDFQYVTAMVWHKNTGLGVGFWLRGDHEYVFFAKRAGAPSIRTQERSIFASPRLRHSSKPDRLHELVEKRREAKEATIERKAKDGTIKTSTRTVPASFPGPFLEIFGRRSREGWTVLGDQSPESMGEDIRWSLLNLITNIGMEQSAQPETANEIPEIAAEAGVS